MRAEKRRKVSLIPEGVPADCSSLFKILICSMCLILLVGVLGCDVKPKEKPLSLGSFTEISSPSISPDGNQILFTGCGHKDFSPCTIYRFERDNNKLYRYLPRNTHEMFHGGRYSPVSNKFVFSIIPLDSNDEKIYDETQIAVVNQDGSGLRIITQSKGLKLNPVLSYDEKCAVFSKGRISDRGSPLRKQKSRVVGSDLYKVDILTGKETQLTRLAFYGVSDTYITPDGKSVVFNGDTPMRLPHTENYDAISQFIDNYKKQYHYNTLIRYPLDGSGVDKEPVPFFTFDTGVKKPTIAKDGSLWFEGIVGSQHFLHYYQRFPDGALKQLPDKLLGEWKQGNVLVVLLQMAVTPDGGQLATLNWNQETRQCYLGVLDTRSNVHTNLTIPAAAENVFIP